MKIIKLFRRRKRLNQNRNNLRQGKKLHFGDIVRVIGCTKMPHDFVIGEVGYIECIDADKYCLVALAEGSGYKQWVAECDLELWEE